MIQKVNSGFSDRYKHWNKASEYAMYSIPVRYRGGQNIFSSHNYRGFHGQLVNKVQFIQVLRENRSCWEDANYGKVMASPRRQQSE